MPRHRTGRSAPPARYPHRQFFTTMPDVSYPSTYECSGCTDGLTVTREDARGLYPDPDSPNAPEVVLQERGWFKGPNGELYCPDCGKSAGR